ncbi:hypothetical protein H5410_023666 [Solanum commersonii]|uniref:Uncharacterized protein n=1 Tax=Solanum commersonii TaxID=4109 RepID=A0A9J5ZHG9_SOLCO|nr:hypothetical protein H5410_023666 [Solanum commersonii]
MWERAKSPNFEVDKVYELEIACAAGMKENEKVPFCQSPKATRSLLHPPSRPPRAKKASDVTDFNGHTSKKASKIRERLRKGSQFTHDKGISKTEKNGRENINFEITLWEEFEALVPPSGYDCEKSKEFIIHLQKLKLFQLLMGINDSYNQARSQILLMTSLPSINQPSAMRFVSVTAGVLGLNPMAHSSNYEVFMYSRTSGGQRFTRYSHLYCEVCKIKGQNKENCWKIVAYPIEFKYKKKKPFEGGSTVYNVIAKESPRNDVTQVEGTYKSQPWFIYGTNTNVHSQSQSAGSMDQIQSKLIHVDASHFTQEQYNHIVLNNGQVLKEGQGQQMMEIEKKINMMPLHELRVGLNKEPLQGPRPVVMTMVYEGVHEDPLVFLDIWELGKLRGATGKGTTSTTTVCGALGGT